MARGGERRCVVLASGSPRRRELLGQLLDDFDIKVSGVPEPVDTGRTPAENMLAIARSKAAAVAPNAGGCLVLAADTDVVLDDEILGKPADAPRAVAMLRRLRGREHEVLTAVVLVDPLTGRRWETRVSSLVLIRALADAEIDRYVATGEPMDKAGGYAIQGEAASMVQRVKGCYTNVVGLPLCATRDLLTEAGVTLDRRVGCFDAQGQPCPR